MGKTVKKNQTQRVARTAFSGTYVVRGKRFTVPQASSEAIAEQMVQNGYRGGATARWNGGEYRLESDHFGDHSLVRIA